MAAAAWLLERRHPEGFGTADLVRAAALLEELDRRDEA